MAESREPLHPHSIEAERALLGGLIQRPDLLDEIDSLVSPDDFWRDDHGNLFRLLKEMQANGEPIDLMTLPERVLRSGEPTRYGGIAYIVELPEHAPSTANLTHYASIVRTKATLRQIMQKGRDLIDLASRHPDDIDEVVSRAAADLVRIGARGKAGSWEPVSVIVDEEIVRFETLGEQEGDTIGVTTGFERLDQITSGLQRGDLVILAARPSMGKTALALNIALNAAQGEGGVAVGIYSLEMSRHQLVDRLLCSLGLVDAGRLRTGRLDEDDWERLIEASDELRKLRIHINDRPGLTIAEVRAHALRLKNEEPDLGLIVLDYLQLMGAIDPRQSRVQQVSEMSRGLKALAKDLDVPVLALSQLSRGVESRADKRPMMSDLRESGAIEQDADVILFIYRDEYYDPNSADTGLAEVIVAKQRSGPTGTVKLAFRKEYTLFTDVAEQDWFSG